MTDFTINVGANSNGPIPAFPFASDGTGFYDGATNGGDTCGGSTPSPPISGPGAQVSCAGWTGGAGVNGHFVIVLYGTHAQSYFASVAVGAPASLSFNSSSASVYDTTTYPGYTVWAWADTHEYTYIGDNLGVTFSGGGTSVPNVVGDSLAAATAAITGVGLTVGTVTATASGTTAGLVFSQSPIAGTSVSPGSAVNLTITEVPNIVGDTQSSATTAISAAGLSVGAVTSAFNAIVPVGDVISQSPAGGAIVVPGSSVSFLVSLGPDTVVVPDILGLTAAEAQAALLAVGLIGGAVTGVYDPAVAVGSVATQSIPAGKIVSHGTAVGFGVSFLVPPFDVDATVISQYANSPRLVQLVEDFGEWFDPSENMQSFYLDLWNIDTAEGFGLDTWGIILGVSRVIPIPGTSGVLGFDTSDTPPDWENFGNINDPTAGGPFDSGQISTGSFKLGDAAYRTLLLTKALANICATTAPALNALISNLFPGRGRCYTIDGGAMTMTYVFEFQITNIEFSILAFSGVLAHPAGVQVNILVIPSDDVFGFQEMGLGVETFDFGTFYNG